MSAADFEAVAPGVSWYYNWGATPLTLPSDVTMDFIPMAWNGSSGFQTSISSYLTAGNRPWRVFALNEPNLLGQAYMTPSNSAVTFLQVKAICDPYGIPVIAPHMAIGSAVSSSITAYDPIMGSNYVYTYQEPFIAAFLYYCGSTPPTGMGTHSYGGYGEITWITSTMNTDFPTQTVWLTEFNASGVGGNTNAATVLANLIPAVDYCERTPWIEGYSWFMSRITGDTNDSLLTSSSGVLTPAGQAYVQMPVHETNLYYRIPGRLEAERYVTMNQMNIAPTTDTNGLADMITAAAGGSLYYNIQVDTAGSYPLDFRVAGAIGQISVYEGGTLLGTANITQTSWSTVSTTVTLPAGTQTLEVVLSANAQQLNWMEFEAVNGPVSVPTGLSATAGNAQVVLSWSTAAGATSYNVQSSTTEGGPYTTIASPTTTSYTNTGLVNGTTYYYVVSAAAGSIVSSNSVEVGATPVLSHVNLALNQPVTVSSTQSG
ncbi:MAG: glycosyl hydrolase [Limisphaerales bacterium]